MSPPRWCHYPRLVRKGLILRANSQNYIRLPGASPLRSSSPPASHGSRAQAHRASRTANPDETVRQPRLPYLIPLTHPQPVSPLQQQRPLVGDGGRLGDVWIEGDKFCFVPAETPLHRLRRHRRIRRNPMNGEAAAEAAETRRFPVYGVSAYTPMCPEGTEGVFPSRPILVETLFHQNRSSSMSATSVSSSVRFLRKRIV